MNASAFRTMFGLTVLALASTAAAGSYTVVPEKFISCTTCHGVELSGNQAVDAPRLNGMESWYVRNQLKAFQNGSRNPQAWRRTALDYDAIANSPMVCDPLRKYHFCSPSEGAAAMVLCRADQARRYAYKIAVATHRAAEEILNPEFCRDAGQRFV